MVSDDTDMLRGTMDTEADDNAGGKHIERVASPTLGAAIVELLQQSEAGRRYVEETVKPVLALVAQAADAIRPLHGALVQFAQEMRPIIEANWGEIQNAVVQFHEGMRRFDEAMLNAEALGRFGWTIPLNADFPDCIRLLENARSAESADAAFLEFYTQNDKDALVLLVADLQKHPKLIEFRGLLEQVWFGLDAEKHLLVVPALLTVFEAAARRCWNTGVWRANQRRDFLEQRVQGSKPESFERVAWNATRAFVDALYAPNFGDDPKPQVLNRHWITHGKGPADGTLADCLRLLQAIHTVLTIADYAETESEEAAGRALVAGAPSSGRRR